MYRLELKNSTQLTDEPILKIFQGVILDNSPYDKKVADDDHNDEEESNDEKNDRLACWIVGVMLELGLTYHPEQIWSNASVRK